MSGVINMDETKTNIYTPITEDLQVQGYKIGIVTSVPITHATPAAYYAKVASRNDAYEIGKQLASGFDYFGGGDFDQKNGPKGTDQLIYEIVEKAGYTIANTKEEILALNNRSGKVVAIDPDNYEAALDYEIDREADELGLAAHRSGKLLSTVGTKDGRIRYAYSNGGGTCGRYRLMRRCLWGIGSCDMDHRNEHP